MNAPLRPASPRRRLPWRMLPWALLALVAIVFLRRHESTYEQRDAPIVQPGAVETRVAGRNFAIEVKKLKIAHAYLLEGNDGHPDGVTLRTPGVWLSVVANVEATQRNGYLSTQIRTRDGLVYAAAGGDRPRLPGVNLGGRELTTGLPETGAYFFELPPDRLQGAHLQAYWGNVLPNGGDSLVDIDLRIDAARARTLLAEAKPVLDLRP